MYFYIIHNIILRDKKDYFCKHFILKNTKYVE